MQDTTVAGGTLPPTATLKHLRIVILADNMVCHPDMLAEHGWACWIEVDDHRLLFDTGQGRVLRFNARHLGVDLAKVEAIVLSHGHFDHSGGIRGVLEQAADCRVFLHPEATRSRYAREDHPPHRQIGISNYDRHALDQRARDLVWTPGPTEVLPGVWVTGEIPQRNELEDAGGPFFLDSACADPDPILDDQALVLETSAGIVVVVGCAHAGVANTLDYVSQLTGGRPIHALVGGLHLAKGSEGRVAATIDALARHQIERINPGHCTGQRGIAELGRALGDRCQPASAGQTLVFGAAA